MTHGLFLFNTLNWENPLVSKQSEPNQIDAQLNDNQLKVQFKEAYNGEIGVNVYSIKGQHIQETNVDFKGRYFEQEIVELDKGVYVIVISTEFGLETIKTVKYSE